MKSFWRFSHFIANLINSSMIDLTMRMSSTTQRRVVTQSRDFLISLTGGAVLGLFIY